MTNLGNLRLSHPSYFKNVLLQPPCYDYNPTMSRTTHCGELLPGAGESVIYSGNRVICRGDCRNIFAGALFLVFREKFARFQIFQLFGGSFKGRVFRKFATSAVLMVATWIHSPSVNS